MVSREWFVRRNCSFSPRQLASAYGVLCTVSLLVATFFVLHGAWFVLAFSILELSALGLAFIAFGRHATDREHIALTDSCLLVELVQVEQVRRFLLDPRRTRVQAPASGRELITLEANGIKVEVGRFLTEWKRREFARELSSALTSER